MSDDESRRLMACAICAEVLFARMDHGEVVAWLHRAELTDVWGEVDGTAPDVMALVKERIGHEPVDHVAVPVPSDEVHTETRCDFCSGPRPGWLLPVEGFRPSESHVGVEDWLVCDVCARLLKKDRWEQVTRRAVLSMSVRYGVSPNEPQLVVGVRELHARVRALQSGPVRRAEPSRVGSVSGGE